MSLAFQGVLSRRKTKGNETGDKKSCFSVFKSILHPRGLFPREGIWTTAFTTILHSGEKWTFASH